MNSHDDVSRGWRPIRRPVSRLDVEGVLRDDEAIREPEPDPELEALRLAILIEDVFGVTLSDHEIDLAALSDPRTAHDIIARHGERR